MLGGSTVFNVVLSRRVSKCRLAIYYLPATRDSLSHRLLFVCNNIYVCGVISSELFCKSCTILCFSSLVGGGTHDASSSLFPPWKIWLLIETGYIATCRIVDVANDNVCSRYIENDAYGTLPMNEIIRTSRNIPHCTFADKLCVQKAHSAPDYRNNSLPRKIRKLCSAWWGSACVEVRLLFWVSCEVEDQNT